MSICVISKKITIIQDRLDTQIKIIGVQRKNLRTPSYAYLRIVSIFSKEITALPHQFPPHIIKIPQKNIFLIKSNDPCNKQPLPPLLPLLPPPPPGPPPGAPPLPASIPAIPFTGVVAGIVAAIVPVAHIIPHIITHVVACRRLPLTPTVVAKVIAHRHRRCSQPPPSSMSRR